MLLFKHKAKTFYYLLASNKFLNKETKWENNSLSLSFSQLILKRLVFLNVFRKKKPIIYLKYMMAETSSQIFSDLSQLFQKIR